MAIATPLLRGMAGFAAYWGDGLRGVPLISEVLPRFYVEPVTKYQVVWSLKPIVLCFLVNGYFPLLPRNGRRIVTKAARA